MLGKNESILIESKNGEYLYGYTPNYVMVKVKSSDDIIGNQINVKLQKIDDDAVMAIK